MSGRIRTIKPELLEDEKVAALADDEFRLFVGLFLVADDYGNFRSNPVWLRGQVFWAREPSRDTRETLESLSDVGLITLYEVKGQHYGHINGWSKHQKIDRPSKAKIPGPPVQHVEPNHNVGQAREGSRAFVEGSRAFVEGSRAFVEGSTNPIGGSGSGSGSGKGSGGECEGNHVQPNSQPPLEQDPPSVADAPALTNEIEVSVEQLSLGEPVASEPGSKTETVTTTEPKSPADDKPAPEPKSSRKLPSRPFPDGWKPTTSHAAKAKELGLDLASEAEAFKDNHVSKGNVFADWNAAFHTWLRNATKYGPASGVRPMVPAPGEYIDVPDDADGPVMSLAEAVKYAPEEYRKPIQEFLGGIR